MATRQFQPRVENVGAARRFVASVLADWGRVPETDFVILLASEVMTNVVVHAGPHGPEAEIMLSVARGGDLVRVEVSDCHPGELVVGDGAVDRMGGRGLLLLDSLASSWGVTGNDAGQVVWFEVRA